MLPVEVVDALVRLGLHRGGPAVAARPLAGGVSSDIWRVDLAGGPICVKRALDRLRVPSDWRASTQRNVYEARWMRQAGAACPGCVPALLGQDPESGVLAMQYLPPDRYKLWKQQLRDGRAVPASAAAVGRCLARLHAASAAAPGLAEQFPTDAIFQSIRIEPYLLATAAKWPEHSAALHALAAATMATRVALVHGDVSPKNILIGPEGPVFLDAECAWWGDPAFDLAFCLNHLLLKCLWTPPARAGFLACFDAFAAAYLARVNWEKPAALEARAARLLPGLLLARIDGRSPVEYVTREIERQLVRGVAGALLARPTSELGAVRLAWQRALPP